MINIAYLTSTLVKTGPNNQLFYIVSNLNKDKFNPIVITLSPELSSSILNDFKNIGITIVQLNLRKYAGMFFAKKVINKTLIKYKIDILQSYGLRGDYVASISKCKKLTTIRNRLPYNYKMLCGSILGKIISAWHLKLFKKFNTIISCSNSVQEYMLNYNINSIAISNGIDINKYPPINNFDNKINFKKSIGISSDSKLFLTVSNKIPGKNVEFLINSFSTLPTLLNYHLLIAGYFPKKLRTKFNNFPNIHFLGIVSNMIEYIKACDFFISASYSEGFSNVILESLLVGTPVILSDIPSHREIIGNEKCGIIFENNSYFSLENVINKMVSMNYESISLRSIEYIRHNYNAKKMASQYEDVYFKLMVS